MDCTGTPYFRWPPIPAMIKDEATETTEEPGNAIPTPMMTKEDPGVMGESTNLEVSSGPSGETSDGNGPKPEQQEGAMEVEADGSNGVASAAATVGGGGASSGDGVAGLKVIVFGFGKVSIVMAFKARGSSVTVYDDPYDTFPAISGGGTSCLAV